MAKSNEKGGHSRSDPLWYKNGVIYQVHVRAYCDSDANGIGDFRGLTQKLDYLQDLGITAVWLLPFYPSPLKDDGYDISDYYSINPIYGNLSDFKRFLKESHKRNIKVITELVVNHTSDQHSWFQRSRRAKPGTTWRDFYVWSDTPEKYKEARIIFKDFETSNWAWDPVAKAYFWHRFYSHQPDLNFDNPQVHKEILRVLDFWLEMGVDGLRLDAVPYLFEREGTNCENLPKTHAYLRTLRRHIDKNYGDRILLAEANQWPEDAVKYFGSGKGNECHMAFHFPLMPRLFMSVRMEDRVPIVDILEQTPEIPPTSQWALFLRNHDELTLEMVTDEERDYMYRVYASDPQARINLGIRRRLAPLLGNDRKRIELLNALLLSLPGTPVIYYGDEIGLGENIYLGDRNGVRTPMQWSSDRNAGFSRANPQSLYLPINLDPENHYEAVNVEAQQGNRHSLLWWMKRMLALRKRWSVFGDGTLTFLHPENRKILALVRQNNKECVLVVANLSRFVQPVKLDLSDFKSKVPVEMFGHTEFPKITDRPYFLTLGPHTFYWFSLEPGALGTATSKSSSKEPGSNGLIKVEERWDEILNGSARPDFESALKTYLHPRRWFAGKARKIKTVRVKEAIGFPSGSEKAFLTLIEVDYVQGDQESYLIPLAFLPHSKGSSLIDNYPYLEVARLRIARRKLDGIVVDAIADPTLNKALLEIISGRRTLKGKHGEITGSSTSWLRSMKNGLMEMLEPSVSQAEQSNSSVIYGDRLILKLFRRPEAGINPDLEIGRFLTSLKFPHTAPLAGALEYHSNEEPATCLAVLHELVPESKDAWEYTLDSLARFYERVQARSPVESAPPKFRDRQTLRVANELPPDAREMVGVFLESARLLGERTAAMHLALASRPDEKDFSPEPFSPHYQRGLFQSMRNLAARNLQMLRQSLKTLPSRLRAEAQKVTDLETEIIQVYRRIVDHRNNAQRIRIHGDFHLGQVLYTGKDFVIIDFEGEPARSLGERRIKRSPLRDVAGMIRSFHYASYAALFAQVDRGTIRHDRISKLEPWTKFWYQSAITAFYGAYIKHTDWAPFLPDDEHVFCAMIDAFLLDKAIYELGYELSNRPNWLRIPIQGIIDLVGVNS